MDRKALEFQLAQLQQQTLRIQRALGAPPSDSVSLPDALAHEINNPLSIAVMEVAELKAQGHDTSSLDYALQRIQAVAAELRLPARLASCAGPLELNRALGTVQDLLGAYAYRVDADLPALRIALEPLALCQLLHAVLVAHLDAGTAQRVHVQAQAEGEQVALVFTGGTPSTRVRASLLALTRQSSGAGTSVPCHVLAQRAASELGVECHLSVAPHDLETRLMLPLVRVPRARRKQHESHRQPPAPAALQQRMPTCRLA